MCIPRALCLQWNQQWIRISDKIVYNKKYEICLPTCWRGFEDYDHARAQNSKYYVMTMDKYLLFMSQLTAINLKNSHQFFYL